MSTVSTQIDRAPDREGQMPATAVRAKHQEFLFPCVANYYQEPLALVKGRGLEVEDVEGRRYLDFFGGILTVSLAHAEPRINAAVKEQLDTLGHTSTLYPNEWIVRLAERMAELTPGQLKKSFFGSSGTEADETAIVLAKIHTGRQEIIALRHSYSGRSLLAISQMGHHTYRPIPSQIPGIVHAHPAYCYRCPFSLTYPSCEVKCAQDLEELILTTTSGFPAAFIAEPIQGVGGFIVPPKEYFQIAVGIVRKHGGLFICDEVQTGFGRTGEKWFGIEHFGVEPDIMTFAKGMANGLPIGATIAKSEIADSWKSGTISTFGGNAISMRGALATLDVMKAENIPERARRLGARLREKLETMKLKYPLIGDVRGMGLMQAVELVTDRGTKAPAPKHATQVMEATKKQGLLVGKGGLYGNTLRIAPPMLVTEAQIDEATAALDKAFAEVRV
jgi:4-aminobutyrate aminotransferase-like enzyme